MMSFVCRLLLVPGLLLGSLCLDAAELRGDDGAALARPVPGTWHHGPIDGLLPHLAPGALVIAEVGADWCGPCNQLAREVLDTPTAHDLLGQDYGLRVDFESPLGQDFATRFGIINLPTTVVIAASGREIGRVEGYPGAREYVESLADARSGRFGLAALENAARQRGAGPQVRFDLARAQLFAGQTEKALPELDALIHRRDVPQAIAAQAARTKGRWLMRVRRQPEAALVFFDAMVERFAASPKDAAHFRYWAANALKAANRADDAHARFTVWQKEAPDTIEPFEYAAAFVVHHAYPTALCDAALDAVTRRDGWTAERHHLEARIRLRQGRRDDAREAIGKALALEPDNALYRNFQARVNTP